MKLKINKFCKNIFFAHDTTQNGCHTKNLNSPELSPIHIFLRRRVLGEALVTEYPNSYLFLKNNGFP